jgi:hypothetical protein
MNGRSYGVKIHFGRQAKRPPAILRDFKADANTTNRVFTNWTRNLPGGKQP